MRKYCIQLNLPRQIVIFQFWWSCKFFFSLWGSHVCIVMIVLQVTPTLGKNCTFSNVFGACLSLRSLHSYYSCYIISFYDSVSQPFFLNYILNVFRLFLLCFGNSQIAFL